MNIDFRLKKDTIPPSKRFSKNEVFGWSRKQQMIKRKCLYCDAWGTFGVEPSDSNTWCYFLCGDHYSNEKKVK